MVRVMMRLYRPSPVVNSLVVIPGVIVVVIWVVRTIIVMLGATRERRQAKRSGKKHGIEISFSPQGFLQ